MRGKVANIIINMQKFKTLIFITLLSSLFLLSCTKISNEQVTPPDSTDEETIVNYEPRGRIIDNAITSSEEIFYITIRNVRFTLPEEWEAKTAYLSGADIKLGKQEGQSMMKLTIKPNILPEEQDLFKKIPELNPGDWYELSCGISSWCYYLYIRDTWYSFEIEVLNLENWDKFKKDLYEFFNSIEMIESPLNTEIFDLTFNDLEDYFSLTNSQEYLAGLLTYNMTPKGYVLIKDEKGEKKKFTTNDSEGTYPYFLIFVEEDYQSKESITFYLQKIHPPKDGEVYGPFKGNLADLLN